MDNKNSQRSVTSTILILCMVIFGQLTAQASGSLKVRDQKPQGGYTEVTLGTDRYYYNQGIFYTGAPGSYVVVEPPPGIVVYQIPYGYQRVVIDGGVYYTYRDVYYRHGPRGYEVVRVQAPPHGRARGHHKHR